MTNRRGLEGMTRGTPWFGRRGPHERITASVS